MSCARFLGSVSAALGLVIFGAATLASAQAPERVAYQGLVLEATGAPVNGPLTVTVRIFDAPVGGTVLFAENHFPTLVDGVFQIEIGGGTLVSGSFDASLFAAGSRWLEVEAAGEVLAPRQEFVSVTYALQCETAAELGGFGSALWQRRVETVCAAGSALRSIAADGTGTCEIIPNPGGDVTDVLAGAGLSVSGSTGPVVTLSIATGGVTGAMVADESLGFADLAPSSVGSSEVADNALGAVDLGTDSVTSAEIASSAVGSAEIADGAVGSADVADESLGAADLGVGSVGTSEVADNSLTDLDLAAGSVTASEIATGAVGTTDIADGGVLSIDILDNTILAADIAANAVGTSEVDGSLVAADLSDEAGANFAFDATATPGTTAGTVASVTIDPPVASGRVIVNASAYVQIDAGVFSLLSCSLTTGSGLDAANFSSINVDGSDVDRTSLGMTRGFVVSSAAATTYNLVCLNSGGTVTMNHINLTAMYFPTVY
jgi:hypothetical protein